MAPLEVDPVADAVLVDRHAGRKLGLASGPAREVLRQRDPLVDVDPEVPRPQLMRAPLQDRADPLVHPQAEDLDREDVVEPVDDQAGEPVALGVEHAVGVGLLVEPEDVAPQRHGLGDPAIPELGAGRFRLPGEQPQADLRPGVPEPEAQRQTVAVDDLHQVALVRLQRADRADHHLPEDERVVPRRADGDRRQGAFGSQASVGNRRLPRRDGTGSNRTWHQSNSSSSS